MSHRRLVLVALGAASLLAAAPPRPTPPPPEPRLVNLRIAEADAPTARRWSINVALDRPNPYPFPISVGVGDYSHIVVRGIEPAAHLRHRDGGRRTTRRSRRSGSSGGRGSSSPRFAVGAVRRHGRRARREHQHPDLGPLARRSTSATTTSTSCSTTTTRSGRPTRSRRRSSSSRTRSCPSPTPAALPYLVTLQLARPAPLAGSVMRRRLHARPTAARRRASDYVTVRPVPAALPGRARTARASRVTLCGDTTPEADEEIDIRAAAPVGVQLVDNDLDLVLRNDD